MRCIRRKYRRKAADYTRRVTDAQRAALVEIRCNQVKTVDADRVHAPIEQHARLSRVVDGVTHQAKPGTLDRHGLRRCQQIGLRVQ